MIQRLIRNCRNRHALSTVFGALLFLILIMTVASALFVSFYKFNDSIQQANAVEDSRAQEKIVIANITQSGNQITGLIIKNVGSITSQIKAFYVNNQFICDPSNESLNAEGAYINSQETSIINVSPVAFDPTSSITVATARGIKAIELESNFLTTVNSAVNPPETYYGPLRLNFTLFSYREVDSYGNPIGDWQLGTNISSSITYCQWNVTVTNIDNRNITLSQYSSLTLVTNQGGAQFPWYTNYASQFIQSNQTVHIIYTWKTPLPCLDAQGFQGFSSLTSKVFLTFYGKFSDGSTYGQTIPFEAILRI